MFKKVKTEEWPEDGELHIPSHANPSTSKSMSPSPFSFSFASASMGAKWDEIEDSPDVEEKVNVQMMALSSPDQPKQGNKLDTRKLCSTPIISTPIHVHIFGKTKMFLASAAKIASVDKKGSMSLPTKSTTTSTGAPRRRKNAAAKPASSASKKRRVVGKKDGLGNVTFSLGSYSQSSPSPSPSSSAMALSSPSSILADTAADVKASTDEARRTSTVSNDDPIHDDGSSTFDKKRPSPYVDLHAPIAKAALRHFQFGCFSFAAVSPNGQEEASIIEMPELACDKHRASLAALKHVLQLYLNYEHLTITTDSGYVADMVKKLTSANGAADSMWISPTQKCADLLQQIWVLLRCRCILELNVPTIDVLTLKESVELRQLDQVVEAALASIHSLASLTIDVSDLAEADVIMNDAVV